MSFFLRDPIDFERHNEEVRKVWAAFHERKPYRVPVTVAGSITNLFCNPEVNDTGYTFEDFFTNPQVQIEAELAFQNWVKHHWLFDQEMGLPKNGWHVGVNFQNSYEAGWFGCPLQYLDNSVPDALPIFQTEKTLLYETEPPDPLRGGILKRAMEFFDYMQDHCPKMEYKGLPVFAPGSIPGEGTDGPFTIACKLRGLTECCIDMYEDPEYFHALMSFVTENTIRRMKAIRQWRWSRAPESGDKDKFKVPHWGFADDSVAMLSVAQYKEFVLPYHKHLVDEFSDGTPISIHLCGDATHLFPFLKEHLNVHAFDTGFPVDFGDIRERLGDEVQISGGPSIMILQHDSPDDVRNEVKRILHSGIMKGGRFVLREANNLAPRTRVENLVAMYQAAKEFGRYE